MLLLPLNTTITSLNPTLPPPPPLPLPPGCHSRHRHPCGQTHHRPWPRKEATSASPPADQWQHQCENVYKSRQLELILLTYGIKGIYQLASS
jgi:hypothetical protein